ncbi:hypothetical protein, partial [Micromonospora sp. MH99]|uniref:hypothetical protein n=1 Tax=Micromonospora sp. MH99 TaxID=1945510 RepID=UPI001F213B77
PDVALPGVALPGVALPGVALPGVALPGVAVLPGRGGAARRVAVLPGAWRRLIVSGSPRWRYRREMMPPHRRCRVDQGCAGA